MSSIEERLEHETSFWSPEEGDQIVGQVLAVDEREGDYGPYPVVHILTRNGDEVIVACGRSVLRQALERYQPAPGDTIGIRYLGEQQTKNGKATFHNYRVVVERGPKSVAAAVNPAGTAAEIGTAPAAATPTDDDAPF